MICMSEDKMSTESLTTESLTTEFLRTEGLTAEPETLTLANLPRGCAATIQRIAAADDGSATEQRLLEIGFEEGKKVEVVHLGPFGDPLAVRVDRQTIGLRRREANLIEVALVQTAPLQVF